MFLLIKQVVIVLLSFSRSVATKCESLKNEPCVTLNNLNPVELNYYPFMISLDKRNGSYNAVFELYAKICVPSETKGVNIKVLNKVTTINEAKTSMKHLLSHCQCKFYSTGCNASQKWNNKTCQCECKNYHMCKKRLWLES